MAKQIAINPPQRKECDGNCRQNDQGWPQHTMIPRAWGHDLQCRLLTGPFGLPDEIRETPLQMRGDKPRAGLHDVEISGRLDTEIPAIRSTKNLHGFHPEQRARLWSRPLPFPALILGSQYVRHKSLY
jgi:hypothetical protein